MTVYGEIMSFTLTVEHKTYFNLCYETIVATRFHYGNKITLRYEENNKSAGKLAHLAL